MHASNKEAKSKYQERPNRMVIRAARSPAYGVPAGKTQGQANGMLKICDSPCQT